MACSIGDDGRCIAGADVRKSTLSDKIATVDAYLKLTLGKHKRAPTKKSKVRQSGDCPVFVDNLTISRHMWRGGCAAP